MLARIIHEIDNSPLNRGLRGVDWVRDPRNVAVWEGDDLALFDYVSPGVYEGHFFFESRGKEAVRVTKMLTQRMFDLGAQMLIGKTPIEYKHACIIARAAGWHYAGHQMTEHGEVIVHLKNAPETH